MQGFRSHKLMSGASVIAMLAAFGAVSPASAADTLSGPGPTFDPYTNAQTDTVTINTDAVVDQDPDTGDSFTSSVTMGGTGTKLLIDDAYLLGDIHNSGSMVSTTANGIVITNDGQVDGAIENSGVIQGALAGISINTTSSLGGGISNTGTIIGSGTAVVLGDDSELFGGITNDGLITGGNGIYINDAEAEFRGGITNTADGTISATNSNVIHFTGNLFTGGISNAGLISGGEGADGIVIDTAAGTFFGGITNTADGIIEATGAAVTAIIISGGTFDGDITNDGQILANGTTSFAVSLSGTAVFTGDIANGGEGLISAGSTAIVVGNATFTGNVTNAGSIVSLSADAIHIGATTAFTGNVINSGVVEALSGTGIEVVTATTLTGSITNSGTIAASAAGINVEGIVTGSIVNSGLIDPDVGIDVDGTVTGGITNSGTILATDTGIRLVDADAATVITQTGGLIQGRSGNTIETAIDMNNTAPVEDTFNGNGGVLDGDVIGDGTDDFHVDASGAAGGTFNYLRGTASGIDQLEVNGGEALFGAGGEGEGDDGEGVTFGAVDMILADGAAAYLDDDTQINLSGTYTQGGEGSLKYFLTSDVTTHGQIAAGGNVTLDGNLVAVVDGSSFASIGGDTFTYEDIITGTISGTFDAVTTTSLFFEGKAVYAANHVDLELLRLSFNDALTLPGLTKNQTSVGNTLEDIYTGGSFGGDFEDLFNYLLSLPAGSEDEVTAIYDELGGAEHAQLQNAVFAASEPFKGAIIDRLEEGRMELRGTQIAESTGLRYASADPSMMDDSSGMGLRRGNAGVSIWGRGFGQWADVNGDDEAQGYDQDTGGVAGGLDVMVGDNALIGGAFGWSTSDVDFNNPGDSADVDSFEFGAYGTYGFGGFYADATVSFAFHDVQSQRQLDLGFDTFTALADYNAHTWTVAGEVGTVLGDEDFNLTPMAGIHYTGASIDGFTETGAGDFGLVVQDSDAESLVSTLGLRASGAWTVGGMRFVPEAKVAWRHEFSDDRQTFTAAFLDDPSVPFQIVSSKVSPDSTLVGAGITADITRGVALFLDYNGLLASDANLHSGSAGLRAIW